MSKNFGPCTSCGDPTPYKICNECLIKQMPEWEYPGQEEWSKKVSEKLLSSKWRMSTG